MKPRQPTFATERNGRVKVRYILALIVILTALVAACTEATPNPAPTTAPTPKGDLHCPREPTSGRITPQERT